MKTAAERVEAKLAELGIDLSALPVIATPAELAGVLHISEGSLAQDRWLGRGLPYVKLGRRVRYVRADVARYLIANRVGAA